MKRLLVLLILWLPVSAHAALNVFACEPEWAALAKEIGGDDVKVYAATTAMQDPHRIEARPSLIAQMRRANLVVCTGADLEVGWLPVLLQNANNAAVQPGRPGYFEAARFVPLLEKPTRLDRADGDVHAAGNPHLHTDPRNILRVAEALTALLAEVDPANAAAHRARGQAFAARWQAAIARWESRAAPLKNLPVAVQHKSFSYLLGPGWGCAKSPFWNPGRASSPRSAIWHGWPRSCRKRRRRWCCARPTKARARPTGWQTAPASRRWRCPTP